MADKVDYKIIRSYKQLEEYLKEHENDILEFMNDIGGFPKDYSMWLIFWKDFLNLGAQGEKLLFRWLTDKKEKNAYDYYFRTTKRRYARKYDDDFYGVIRKKYKGRCK